MPVPVLVLDLSSALYIGLVSGDRVLASRVRPQGTRGENAHALLDECLAEAGLSPSDIAAICVGMGPGSFTGIRVCGAMAQGLAFARNLPLHPFSSLAGVESALAPDASGGVSAIAANAGRWYARARRDSVEAMITTEALLALAAADGAASPLMVSGNVPERERLASAFGSISAFEERVDFARLAALGLAGPPARDGALRPNYLAASAAEDKLRAGLLGKPGLPGASGNPGISGTSK
jgi:tRNA threonylcarbamoyl adenosine modification protein YeaZ